MTIHGVDVSNYQADWKPEADDKFVFIKSTEGHTYKSPSRSNQANVARDRGMLVGFYHFLHPGDIALQVRHFLENTPMREGDLLVCDWEFQGTTNEDKDLFIRVLKKAAPKYKVGLYCNTNWWHTHDTSSYAGDFLWIANYGKNTGVEYPVKFWQYSDKPIDQNTGYFDSLPALKTWALEFSTSQPVETAPAAPVEPPVVAPPKAATAQVIAGGKITTPYGAKANDPSTGRSYWIAGFHPGDDWNKEPQDLGLPAYSAVSGKVVHAGTGGWGSAYGKHVIVESSDGRRTAHCHFSAVTVTAGQIVNAGQQLGKVGATGHVTGPHCHVERRRSPFGYNNHLEKPVYEKIKAPFTWDGKSFPGSDNFYLGAHGDYVTYLGTRLVAHGWTGYKGGPGPTFTDVDQNAVAWFQKKQGWTGSAADGIPGAVTWALLVADPVIVPDPPVVVPPPVPKPSFKMVAELDAPGSGAWEGAVCDIVTGRWYLAHSAGSGDGYIYEFSKVPDVAKPYKSKMTFKNLTHIYGFGVHDGRVYLTWDDKGGNDIVQIPYRAGKTVKKSDGVKLHVFTEHSAQMTFSDDRKSVVVCETIGLTYRFTIRNLADVLSNVNKPIGKSIVLNKPTTPWLQGFSTNGESIYVGWGKPGAKTWIDKYSSQSGKKTSTLDVSASGRLPNEKTLQSDAELESLDGSCFSRKVYHDADRRMRVYQIANF